MYILIALAYIYLLLIVGTLMFVQGAKEISAMKKKVTIRKNRHWLTFKISWRKDNYSLKNLLKIVLIKTPIEKLDIILSSSKILLFSSKNLKIVLALLCLNICVNNFLPI